MKLRRCELVLPVLVVLSCGSGTTTGGGASSQGASATGTSTRGAGSDASTSAGPATGTSTGTSTGSTGPCLEPDCVGNTFSPESDVLASEPCGPWSTDCPAGMHCDMITHDEAGCVPIPDMPLAVDAPCQPGDPCPVGTACRSGPVGTINVEWRCRPLCAEADPTCPEGMWCDDNHVFRICYAEPLCGTDACD